MRCALLRWFIILTLTINAGAAPREDASLIQNATFETSGLTGWSCVNSNGNVEIAWESSSNTTNQHSVRLTVRQLDSANGLVYGSTNGFSIQADAWYDLKFRAKAAARENGRGFALNISLENKTGDQLCARTTLPEVTGDWSDQVVALRTHHAAATGRLVITLTEPGTVWLDDLQLTVRPTGDSNQNQ
jgi:hypothetical protein